MSFLAWTEDVTRRVRQEYPDLGAVRVGKSVRWTLGARTATVTATANGEWWTKFHDPSTGPQHAGIYCTRHDSFTATNVAGTLVTYFFDYQAPENSKRHSQEHTVV